MTASGIEPAAGNPAYQNMNPHQQSAAAVPQDGITPSATTATSATPATPVEIILDVVENSWIEIKGQGGEVLVSKVLKAGERYYIPDRPDLVMSVGNAGGISLSLNGKPVSSLGERGQIRKDIALDAASLNAMASQ
jgi:cytoskeleton protein RodZ